MKRTTLILLLPLLLALAGCTPNYIYEKSVEIPGQRWLYEEKLEFPFTITDTNSLYTIWLDVEHSTAFSSQNLYVKISTKYPDGTDKEQVVSLEMADKAGQWLGRCNKTLCNLHIPLQERAYFQNTGAHKLTIEQYSRTDSLSGIKSMSLLLEDKGVDRE